VTVLGVELGSKRPELLHELAPTANIVAALVNPNTPAAETQSTDLQTAARTLGLKAKPARRRLDRAARQRAAVRRPPVDNLRVRRARQWLCSPASELGEREPK